MVPATDVVGCHLYPGQAPDKGGGLSFAPGKMLIGVPIVDSYMLSHGVSAICLQKLPCEEMYWKSGYEHIR